MSGINVEKQLFPACQQLSKLNSECLASVLVAAEHTQGTTEDHPELTAALEEVIVEDTNPSAIELKCNRCVATGTILAIGGKSIALLHDGDMCPVKTTE